MLYQNQFETPPGSFGMLAELCPIYVCVCVCGSSANEMVYAHTTFHGHDNSEGTISLPTRTMQCDLILLVQKLSETMGPSCVSSSFSCMVVKGRVRCSTWRILLGGFLAGDGVRRLTGEGKNRINR